MLYGCMAVWVLGIGIGVWVFVCSSPHKDVGPDGPELYEWWKFIVAAGRGAAERRGKQLRLGCIYIDAPSNLQAPSTEGLAWRMAGWALGLGPWALGLGLGHSAFGMGALAIGPMAKARWPDPMAIGSCWLPVWRDLFEHLSPQPSASESKLGLGARSPCTPKGNHRSRDSTMKFKESTQ